MENSSRPLQKVNHTQLVLSYELLLLLRWIVEHDMEQIKKLVTKAYRSGLSRELTMIHNQQQLELLHGSVAEFFGMLEELLDTTIHEQVRFKAQQQNLMQSVDKIDLHEYDGGTVQDSLEKATGKTELDPEANPKELLFEELLKRWKPHDKSIVN